jgi:mono/diheme cytochrome c family protein
VRQNQKIECGVLVGLLCCGACVARLQHAVPLVGRQDLVQAKGQPGYDDALAIAPLRFSSSPEPVPGARELFLQNRAPCHGWNGYGDGPAGTALCPQPTDLRKVANYRFGHGDLAVYRSVKFGVPETGMAAWEGRLTDRQIGSITRYVRSMQASPTFGNTPLPQYTDSRWY